MYGKYNNGALFSSSTGSPLLPTTAVKVSRGARRSGQRARLISRLLLAFMTIAGVSAVGYYSSRAPPNSAHVAQEGAVKGDAIGSNSARSDSEMNRRSVQAKHMEGRKGENDKTKDAKLNQGSTANSKRETLETVVDHHLDTAELTRAAHDLESEAQQALKNDVRTREIHTEEVSDPDSKSETFGGGVDEKRQVTGSFGSQETVINGSEVLAHGADSNGSNDEGAAETAASNDQKSFYDMGFIVPDIHGIPFSFDSLKGQVTLVMNVASHCGYTKDNYEGIQEVLNLYGEYGFEVIAFPCNDFGQQEPDEPEVIEHFVRGTHNSTVQLMGKIDHINAGNPVFDYLRAHAPPAPGIDAGAEINWNFNKFLVDKSGKVVRRYASDMKDSRMVHDVYEELVRGTAHEKADDAGHSATS